MILYKKHAGEKPYQCYCPKCGFVGNPSVHTCDNWHSHPCVMKPNCAWEGLGDIVACLIKIVTLGRLKPKANCRCRARQAWLNTHVPIDRFPLRLIMPIVCWRFIWKGVQ